MIFGQKYRKIAEQKEKETSFYKSMLDIFEGINQEQHRDELFDFLSKEILKLFCVECCEIFLYSRNPKESLVRKSIYLQTHYQESYELKGERELALKIDETILGDCFIEGKEKYHNFLNKAEFINYMRTNYPKVPEILLTYYEGILPSGWIRNYLMLPLTKEFIEPGTNRDPIGAIRLLNKFDGQCFLQMGEFAENDVKSLKSVCGRIAAKLTDLYLIEQLEEKKDKIKGKNRVDEVISEISKKEGDLQSIFEEIQGYFTNEVNSLFSSLWLYDSDYKRLVLAAFSINENYEVIYEVLKKERLLSLKAEDCLIGKLLREQNSECLYQSIINTNYGWEKVREYIPGSTLLAIPLKNADLDINGIIVLHPPDEFILDKEKSELYLHSGQEFGIALENAKKWQMAKHMSELIEGLKRIPDNYEKSKFFNSIADLVKVVTCSEYCSILTAKTKPGQNRKEHNLLLEATTDKSTSSRRKIGSKIYEYNPEGFPEKKPGGAEKYYGVTSYVASKREAVIIYNIEDLEKELPIVDKPSQELLEGGKLDNVIGYMGIPLLASNGDLIGVIKCINKERRSGHPTVFTVDDRECGKLLGTFLAQFIENENKFSALTRRLGHELVAPSQTIWRLIDKFENFDMDEGLKKKWHSGLANCELMNYLIATLNYGVDDISKPCWGKRNFGEIAREIMDPLREYGSMTNSGAFLSWGNLDLPGEIWMDPNQIKQVLLNLLLNAFKYSDKGSKIRLCVTQKNKYFIISVENNGIGILEEEKELIFKRGYRNNEAQKKDSNGLGIGLWISRIIVENHGGKLQVDSLNNPTIIAMYLPTRLRDTLIIKEIEDDINYRR